MAQPNKELELTTAQRIHNQESKKVEDIWGSDIYKRLNQVSDSATYAKSCRALARACISWSLATIRINRAVYIRCSNYQGRGRKSGPGVSPVDILLASRMTTTTELTADERKQIGALLDGFGLLVPVSEEATDADEVGVELCMNQPQAAQAEVLDDDQLAAAPAKCDTVEPHDSISARKGPSCGSARSSNSIVATMNETESAQSTPAVESEAPATSESQIFAASNSQPGVVPSTEAQEESSYEGNIPDSWDSIEAAWNNLLHEADFAKSPYPGEPDASIPAAEEGSSSNRN
ncbi:hypothetical protein BDW59DRAFT_166468 [Aspergillus cavernicola]|uniref:Uncharacterized protein n=1 Tax=Aspergillus cavernicola TaxID=176166 RepID=A0ABR4HL23_9EURO